MDKKKKQNNYIPIGTQTLIGPLIRVFDGIHFIVECKYANVCLSREEVEKIMIKENDK